MKTVTLLILGVIAVFSFFKMMKAIGKKFGRWRPDQMKDEKNAKLYGNILAICTLAIAFILSFT